VPGSFVPCASNLRQIGQACQLYATEQGGSFSPDLAVLIKTTQLSPAALVCRSSADSKGACSYIYVGRGLTRNSSPDCIVAFGDPGNHGLEGAHLLRASGQVEWIDLPTLVSIFRSLDDGRNPPVASALLTLTQARQEYQSKWAPRCARYKLNRAWDLSADLPSTQP
jgi:hypothetical protein